MNVYNFLSKNSVFFKFMQINYFIFYFMFQNTFGAIMSLFCLPFNVYCISCTVDMGSCNLYVVRRKWMIVLVYIIFLSA